MTRWPGGLVFGPRAVVWRLRFLARQDQHPRARRAKWVRECGLEPGAPGRDLAMRCTRWG
eukprot:11192628-Lingulodinium_polyedra.AAC.1